MNPDALLCRGLGATFLQLRHATTDEETYLLMNRIWSAGYHAALTDCADESHTLED